VRNSPLVALVVVGVSRFPSWTSPVRVRSPALRLRRPPLGGRRFWCPNVTLWWVACDS